MDPLTLAGSAERLGVQHGFNALLVLFLIGAMVIIVRSFLSFLKDERTEARAERAASIAERKESRDAHLGAIKEVTAELRELRRARS